MMQRGRGLGCGRRISLGNVRDDLVEIRDGSLEPQNFHG